MTIKKVSDNWYQARQLLNEKVFWGYGRTEAEAIESLYKNDFEQELKKIINQKDERINKINQGIKNKNHDKKRTIIGN